jgi:hypothetical protein
MCRSIRWLPPNGPGAQLPGSPPMAARGVQASINAKHYQRSIERGCGPVSCSAFYGARDG